MHRCLRSVIRTAACLVALGACTSEEPATSAADAYVTKDASPPASGDAAFANVACPPDFALKHGWLGADGAASVDLGQGRSLWLFGDTFAGPPTQLTRAGTTFARNSIAITSCADGGSDVRYFVRFDEKGKPVPFFAPSTSLLPGTDGGSNEASYLWPLDGFMHGGTLFLTFNVVRNTNAGGAFAFEVIGTTLARVDHPENDPMTWSPTFSDLTTTSEYGSGLTIVRDETYGYFYGLISAGATKGSLMLSRISLATLLSQAPGASLPPLFETLDEHGSWANGISALHAKAVYDQAAPEMTIRFHPSEGRYVAVQGAAGYFTRKVVARTAFSVSGPWSSPVEMFAYPEMAAGADKDTFCYASREHVEYNSPTAFAVSYACNSLDFAKAVADTKLYVPRLVFLPLPK